jgi:hypothetical protein
MAEQVRLDYIPDGPVLKAYFRSTAPVHAIMGPIGSGKTSASLMKPFRFGPLQMPDPRGEVKVRRTKWVQIRKTYRDLERTTIPSYFKLIPKDAGEWRGGTGGEPASHTIRLPMTDGTVCEIGVLFVALGDNDIESVLRGFEYTGAGFGELDLMDRSALTYAIGRAGRYPESFGDFGPSWHGVWADMNAPDTDSWTYDVFVEDLPEGWAFFQQPGGLEREAENLKYLPGGRAYYDNQMKGAPDWYVRRMIHNQFGFSRDGKPVYPEYNDVLHSTDRVLEPIAGKALIVGLDAGRKPAAVFQAVDNEGQVQWIAELVCQDIGAKAFGKRLSLFIAERFPGVRCIGSADPSAAYPSDTANEDDQAWIDIVRNEAEIEIKPAPTNQPGLRQEAVRQPLARMISGDKPGFLLSRRHCPILRRGFNSGYRYKRIKIGGSERYDDVPEKNDYSHPHDGGQYAALRGTDFSDLIGRRKRRGSGRLEVVTGYDPMTLRAT